MNGKEPETPRNTETNNQQGDKQEKEATVNCPLCSRSVPPSDIQDGNNQCPHCNFIFDVKYE